METEIWKNLSLEDLPNEEWRDVAGYEGSYMVSNLGRVKSLPTQKFKKPIRILSAYFSGNGYLTVKLQSEGKIKNIRVHQLVAQAFIPNPNNYSEINHIDENKLNNLSSNLQWCSRSFNVNYGGRNIAVAYKLRNRKDQSKIVQQIDKDGNVLREFRSLSEACRYYKCSKNSIGKVCRNEKNHYKEMLFKYKL